jgi:hypothetical protein
VTTRLLKTGYRLVIAVDVFSVLMWVWLCYGLSSVRMIGWFIPTLIGISAVVVGLVWLAAVRIAFEYLMVIFGISGKVHDLDRKVEYLATVTYNDRNPQTDAPESPDVSGEPIPAEETEQAA